LAAKSANLPAALRTRIEIGHIPWQEFASTPRSVRCRHDNGEAMTFYAAIALHASEVLQEIGATRR
jgi:hypothetical protein